MNSEKPLRQGFRPRWTSRNINVYGNNLVNAFTNRVRELEKTAATRAASHRDDILRIGCVLVGRLGSLPFFEIHRPANVHKARLRGRAPRAAPKQTKLLYD